MISIRRNVFETNSSSTHSITMCSENEYDKWKSGELLFDYWNDELITKEEYEKKYNEEKKEYLTKYPNETEEDFEDYMEDDKRYYTFTEFWEYIESDYETFEEKYETKSGDKVVAFGYYGYNG